MSSLVAKVNGGAAVEYATFGAGCFWGVEKLFRKNFGDKLRDTKVGYMGGHTKEPTYKEVCSGTTGHTEVLQIQFVPSEVSYENLLRYFFRIHDSTSHMKQGRNSGTQYRTVIFVHSQEQKQAALKIKDEIQPRLEQKIMTDIEELDPSNLWPAEEYHQLYLQKNPEAWCSHREHW